MIGSNPSFSQFIFSIMVEGRREWINNKLLMNGGNK